MDVVLVSADYRVVIPKSLRAALAIKPGVTWQVLHDGDRLVLLPLRSPRDLRGFLKGMGGELRREGDKGVW